MKTTQLHYLSHQHLEVQIWKQEINFVEVELPLLTNLFAVLDRQKLSPAVFAQYDEFTSRMAHFRRLLPSLREEIDRYDHEVVEGWKETQTVDAELRLDHRYLRQKMEDFHHDYTGFKRTLRAFIVWQESAPETAANSCAVARN